MEWTVPRTIEHHECDPEIYQSEAKMEALLVHELLKMRENGTPSYEKIHIRNDEELEENLRRQLERLNGKTFADWPGFFEAKLANSNMGMAEKQKLFQHAYIQTADALLPTGETEPFNFRLIDHDHPENNLLQVVEQTSESGPEGGRNRFDVTILVNGFPLIHIELKNSHRPIKLAFNQIQRYHGEGFSWHSRLYEYTQIFVISNGIKTRYFANTLHETNAYAPSHISGEEFMISWSDSENNVINDLIEFAHTFLKKAALLRILTRYMVLTGDGRLLVMRPYQICAVEAILAHAQKREDGYVWHTTGSGKTLTSFKAAQLLADLPGVEKVVFVVDRRDLDTQSSQAYQNYSPNLFAGTENVRALEARLRDPEVHLIVTTIQKLNRFVKYYQSTDDIFQQRIIFMFDECHRSTFGEMMRQIRIHFRDVNRYGFTGTPIFDENARTSLTTQAIFGPCLHKYTIMHAIRDHNVLPFRLISTTTLRVNNQMKDTLVERINRRTALEAPERIRENSAKILEMFEGVVGKFASLLTTASIAMAKQYYTELTNQIRATNRQINVGIIYSAEDRDRNDTSQPARSPVEVDDVRVGDTEDYLKMGKMAPGDQDFLHEAMRAYDAQFKTSFATRDYETLNGRQRHNYLARYYADVIERTRNCQIQILIVVNMCLTGFDAPRLNTIFVDRFLEAHNLIQAFSRTNRIYGPQKGWGTVVAFQSLKAETDDALCLFGGPDAPSVAQAPDFKAFYYGSSQTGEGYLALSQELQARFNLDKSGDELFNELWGNAGGVEFVNRFGEIYRSRFIMNAFVEAEERKKLEQAFPEVRYSKAVKLYLQMYRAYQNGRSSGVDIENDVVYQTEIIQEDCYDLTHILDLIHGYAAENKSPPEINSQIADILDTHVNLVGKKKLVEQFVAEVDALHLEPHPLEVAFWNYANQAYEDDVHRLATEESLRVDALERLLQDAFQNGYVNFNGGAVNHLLVEKSGNLFSRRDTPRRQEIQFRITEIFNTYRDILVNEGYVNGQT